MAGDPARNTKSSTSGGLARAARRANTARGRAPRELPLHAELDKPWAYPAMIALTIGIFIVLCFLAKRARWLKERMPRALQGCLTEHEFIPSWEIEAVGEDCVVA